MDKLQWDAWAIKKFGSIEAGKKFMREKADRSSRNALGLGGFGDIKKTNPELHKELSSRGGQKGRHAPSDTNSLSSK